MVAGGIATVEDVIQLRDIGAAGAITGMAIYTGSLDLTDAIRAVN
jgi:phosphoribosylformimino-5-aminoimidazole carboxamide ribotide isomerase